MSRGGQKATEGVRRWRAGLGDKSGERDMLRNTTTETPKNAREKKADRWESEAVRDLREPSGGSGQVSKESGNAN